VVGSGSRLMTSSICSSLSNILPLHDLHLRFGTAFYQHNLLFLVLKWSKHSTLIRSNENLWACYPRGKCLLDSLVVLTMLTSLWGLWRGSIFSFVGIVKLL
jgi:hypothetical protein